MPFLLLADSSKDPKILGVEEISPYSPVLKAKHFPEKLKFSTAKTGLEPAQSHYVTAESQSNPLSNPFTYITP